MGLMFELMIALNFIVAYEFMHSFINIPMSRHLTATFIHKFFSLMSFKALESAYTRLQGYKTFSPRSSSNLRIFIGQFTFSVQSNTWDLSFEIFIGPRPQGILEDEIFWHWWGRQKTLPHCMQELIHYIVVGDLFDIIIHTYHTYWFWTCV